MIKIDENEQLTALKLLIGIFLQTFFNSKCPIVQGRDDGSNDIIGALQQDYPTTTTMSSSSTDTLSRAKVI